VYNNGLVRFCTGQYSTEKKDIKCKFMHLTNYSVNKKAEAYVANETGVGSSDTSSLQVGHQYFYSTPYCLCCCCCRSFTHVANETGVGSSDTSSLQVKQAINAFLFNTLSVYVVVVVVCSHTVRDQRNGCRQ
jgi:hypothetical protein